LLEAVRISDVPHAIPLRASVPVRRDAVDPGANGVDVRGPGVRAGRVVRKIAGVDAGGRPVVLDIADEFGEKVGAEFVLAQIELAVHRIEKLEFVRSEFVGVPRPIGFGRVPHDIVDGSGLVPDRERLEFSEHADVCFGEKRALRGRHILRDLMRGNCPLEDERVAKGRGNHGRHLVDNEIWKIGMIMTRHRIRMNPVTRRPIFLGFTKLER
jgi:hypothetical protein